MLVAQNTTVIFYRRFGLPDGNTIQRLGGFGVTDYDSGREDWLIKETSRAVLSSTGETSTASKTAVSSFDSESD
jgi:hypothetical protein